MRGSKKTFILLIILLTIIGVSFISINIATNKTISEKIADMTSILSKKYLMLTTNIAEEENEKEIDEEEYVLEQDISYVETLDNIPNPERGFYRTQGLNLKQSGNTASSIWSKLTHLRVSIGKYSAKNEGGADVEFTEDALKALNDTLANARKSGATVIIRFAYDDFNGKGNVEPPVDLIIKHIEQLKPVFYANEDVISYIELGLFGLWGEMHGSEICRTENFNRAIDAMLESAPESIKIAVRTPGHFVNWVKDETTSSINKEIDRARLNEYVSEKGTPEYRVGIFNDGYLGTDYDLGTFIKREPEIAWIEKQAMHTLYGGEVVANYNTSTPAINTAAYMAKEAFITHTTYLNAEWNGNVINSWKDEIYNGDDELYKGKTGYEYINNHLGYRWVLRESKHTNYIKKEDNLKIKLKIENVGFANLINSKTSTLVLEKEEKRYEIPINIDPTTWWSRQTSDVNIEVAVPEDITLGEWNMYLRISQYGNLETDNNYQCIQLANEDIWNQEIGANYIGKVSIVADINDTEIILENESYEYDGEAKEPEVTVKDGDKTLIINTDYTVTYSNNINAGIGIVTITGVGNYTRTKTKEFTIIGEEISTVTVTLENASYEYDGEAKEPSVTVNDGNKTLTINTDYTVTYSNNINAGTGIVTITGVGNYTGTKTKEFTIIGKGISTATVTLENENYEYDGEAKEPLVTVNDGNKTLTINTDYTVTYSDNINIGTGTLTITGVGNYTGTKSKTFEIVKKDVSRLEITLTQSLYEYDGEAKEPSVTVNDGNKTLTINTDYTITYSNNINAGTGIVTITGVGNYIGAKTKEYTITGKGISTATVTLENENYEYDGEAKEPSVTVNDGNKTLTINTDYTVTYSNNINAGTGIVTITGVGNYIGAKTKEFTIIGEEISTVTVTLENENYEYDGEAKEPSVTVNNGNKTLIINTDYTVTYSNNINAGTGIVTITGVGNYTGTSSKNFNIAKATPKYVVPSGLISAVGCKLESVTLPNGFSWETNVNTEMKEVGVKKFLCKFTPEDTNNFNTVTGIEVELLVNEKLFVNIEKFLTKKVELSNLDEKQFIIYIYGLKEGQTIEEINENIKTNGNKEIYKNDDEKILDSTTKIATGMKIKVSSGAENIEYRLVVKGDNDGDGKFSGKDLLRLARYLAELDTSLKYEYLYASDVYSDEKINGADLLKMARSLCNLETL